MSLIHLSSFSCTVLGGVLFHSFMCSCSVFPAPLIEEAVFSPLYIPASYGHGPFLKSWLNLLQYWFSFTFWFFGQEACWILAPWPGFTPTSPALEDETITTGPSEKSPSEIIYIRYVVLLYFQLVVCILGRGAEWVCGCSRWILSLTHLSG